MQPSCRAQQPPELMRPVAHTAFCSPRTDRCSTSGTRSAGLIVEIASLKHLNDEKVVGHCIQGSLCLLHTTESGMLFMNLCCYACMATHAWLQHLQMGEAQPIILKRAYSEPKVSQRTRDGQLTVPEHASKRNNSNRAFNLTGHIPYPDHSCWRLYLCSPPNLSLSTSYRHGSREDLNHE
jgi:hypothetical protein